MIENRMRHGFLKTILSTGPLGVKNPVFISQAPKEYDYRKLAPFFLLWLDTFGRIFSRLTSNRAADNDVPTSKVSLLSNP
jgi:hypothetical protein